MSKRRAPEVKVINMALEGQLMPPRPECCQQCARKHEPELPHDQQSLFWQYWFYRQCKGERWPTWHDAMAHCTPEVRARWAEALKHHGVELPPEAP